MQHNHPAESRKAIAVSFLRLVASGKVDDAYNSYIAQGFWHHNAWFAGDRESLKAAMTENAIMHPDKTLDIKHVLGDGDLVAVHSHIRQTASDIGAAVVHIFRFEGDKIVELWDLGQAVQPDSPNEHGVF